VRRPLLLILAAVAVIVLVPVMAAGPASSSPGSKWNTAGVFSALKLLGSSCSPRPTGAQDQESSRLQALQESAVASYVDETGDEAPVEARIRDFGCHIEAHIYRDGLKIKTYLLQGDSWVAIPG